MSKPNMPPHLLYDKTTFRKLFIASPGTQPLWFSKGDLLKKGKAETSQLSQAINQLTGPAHNNSPKCRSQDKTFNTEAEAQWKKNQNQLSHKEFVNAINFFYHTKGAGPSIEANTTRQLQQANQ
jgi:hypothetical protein